MCDCKVCSSTRRWLDVLNIDTPEKKAAFEEIMLKLEAAETDAVYYRMKFEGTWPT